MVSAEGNEEWPAVFRPQVAVVLTTYNGHAFIREQLDSLLAQAGVCVHIYAFDDDSTDDTASILHEYADEHPGIFTVFVNKPNSGGTGLNVFRNASRVPRHYDYVALADQDDFWLPVKLQSAIMALSERRADLYFSNLLAWDGANRITGVVNKTAPLQARDHLFGGGSAGCTYVMAMPFFAHVQDVLANTEIGGVRRISHDWIIYFLARHYGWNVYASPDALIKYRIHPNSQYGGMSRGGLTAIRRKLRMLRSGFLREQVDNALLFARDGTEDREILLRFRKGRLQRLAILLKYRRSLVRTRSRLLLLWFAFLSFR